MANVWMWDMGVNDKFWLGIWVSSDKGSINGENELVSNARKVKQRFNKIFNEEK
jgi:hypothetical protein